MKMDMIIKWLRVGIELILATVIIAISGALWLLMVVPDPVSILIGFVGICLLCVAMGDADKVEAIARKRAKKRKKAAKTAELPLNKR